MTKKVGRLAIVGYLKANKIPFEVEEKNVRKEKFIVDKDEYNIDDVVSREYLYKIIGKRVKSGNLNPTK
jgi:hypothetical protein